MMSICKQMQAQPAVQLPPPRGMRLSAPWRQREKVVVVMGATGTGKSRLSVELATAFRPAEVINSDKIQIYDGLEVLTNKITAAEQRGVRHHLLSTVSDPDSDFTAADFSRAALRATEEILRRDAVPIVVGGSNSFVEELVDGGGNLRHRFDLCLLWVDVEMSVLHARVSGRVDEMVQAGMVEEAARLFDPAKGYDRGIRRAIGVPEFDRYFRGGARDDGALSDAVAEVKENTYRLARRQYAKIRRLAAVKGWVLHRLDATEAYRPNSAAESELAWQRHVAGPGAALVRRFLFGLDVEFPMPMLPPSRRAAALAAYH